MNPRRLLPTDPSVITVLAAAAPALAVAAVANVVLMRRQVERARRDPLTGLLTRTGWTGQARRIIRDPRAVVVLLDLDDFKTVNDTHGHATGDAVLISIAHRLTGWCGPTGIVGRIGGDEFVAVLIHHGPDDLDTRIARLHHELAHPVPGIGKPLSVSASIGYVRSTGLPGADLSELLRRADTAMYVAKKDHIGHHIGGSADAAAFEEVRTNGRRRGRLGTTRGRRLGVAA